MSIISNIFQIKGEKLDRDFNYKNLLDDYSFSEIITSKEKFIIFGIFLVSFYAIIYHFDDILERKLAISGKYFSRNLLLNKYRLLGFEDRIERRNEISILIESDASKFGYY